MEQGIALAAGILLVLCSQQHVVSARPIPVHLHEIEAHHRPLNPSAPEYIPLWQRQHSSTSSNQYSPLDLAANHQFMRDVYRFAGSLSIESRDKDYYPPRAPLRYAPPGFVPFKEAGKLRETGIAKTVPEAVDADHTNPHPSSSSSKQRSNKASQLKREEEERKNLSKSKKGKAGKELKAMGKKTTIGDSDVNLFKDVDLHLTDPSEVQQAGVVESGTSKTAEDRNKKKALHDRIRERRTNRAMGLPEAKLWNLTAEADSQIDDLKRKIAEAIADRKKEDSKVNAMITLLKDLASADVIKRCSSWAEKANLSKENMSRLELAFDQARSSLS